MEMLVEKKVSHDNRRVISIPTCPFPLFNDEDDGGEEVRRRIKTNKAVEKVMQHYMW